MSKEALRLPQELFARKVARCTLVEQSLLSVNDVVGLHGCCHTFGKQNEHWAIISALLFISYHCSFSNGR